MVKALRRWLEANELLRHRHLRGGPLVVLSLLLVLGGYLIVTRLSSANCKRFRYAEPAWFPAASAALDIDRHRS